MLFAHRALRIDGEKMQGKKRDTSNWNKKNQTQNKTYKKPERKIEDRKSSNQPNQNVANQENRDDSSVRLNKYLAEAGVCSRREADKLIDEGRVTIDGKVATMGHRVAPGGEVFLNGKPIGKKHEKVVLAYYKPVGITCTEKDKFAEMTIMEAIKYPIRVTYAGRLDKDSEGLILLSNDGDLIHALMKGANLHEKEYLVKVNREVTSAFIEKMASGVYLEELKETTRACEVEAVGKFTFRIILTQGLNRQIRRMCQTFGYDVIQLKRVRINKLEIGKLHVGTYRRLYGEELEQLYQSVGMKK